MADAPRMLVRGACKRASGFGLGRPQHNVIDHEDVGMRQPAVVGLVLSSSVRADQSEPPPSVETVGQAPGAVVPPEAPIPQLDERTAFMVGKNKLKLGILAFEYGILRRLSVGSDPPPGRRAPP